MSRVGKKEIGEDGDITTKTWFKIYTAIAFLVIFIVAFWALNLYGSGTIGFLGLAGIVIAIFLLSMLPIVVIGRIQHRQQLH